MGARFSVLTPSYNHAEFIRQTIDSVLQQNYPDFEHIIMDGGSTDGTLEILKGYPHLTVVSESDRGQTHALNKAMRIASGDYIAWINSDDWYLPGAFHEAAAKLKDHPVVLSGCNFTDRAGTVTETVNNIERNWFDILKYWIYHASPAQPGIFFTRQAMEAVRLKSGDYLDEDLYYCMDYELWLRLAAKFPFSERIEKPLACFRNYDTNKSGQDMAASYREDSRVYRRHSLIHCGSERKISFVMPLQAFTAEAQITLTSLSLQAQRDLELLLVDYNAERSISSALRKAASDLDRDTPQISIRHVRCHTPTKLAAIQRGIEAARAPIVAFLEPGAAVPPTFTLEASNLFENDFVGAALPLKSSPDLINHFSTVSSGVRVISLDGILSGKSMGFHLVVRKVALDELGGIKSSDLNALGLRQLLLRLVYKGWQVSVDNSLGCDLAPGFPHDDQQFNQLAPYIISKMVSDLADELASDHFGRLRIQNGFGFSFPEDSTQKARELLKSAPSGWETQKNVESKEWLSAALASHPSFEPTKKLLASLV